MENLIHIVGGGSSIGTSCYYVQVDGHRFLLDCGATLHGRPHIPAFHELDAFVDGLWQLDAVVVSHAHFDHVGALPYIAGIGETVPILCNPITETLTTLQLGQREGLGRTFHSPRQRAQYTMQTERVLTQVKPWGFGIPYTGDGFRLTLYPAGHIPGAAMTYIETEHHRILYSGDFSCQLALLGGAYALPDGVSAHILLCEGTHGYRESLYGASPVYERLAQEVAQGLGLGPVIVETSTATKGIELARYLARILPAQYDINRTIYIDRPLLSIAEAFEEARYQVFSKDIQPWPEGDVTLGESFVLLTRPGRHASWGIVLRGDAFTLHASQGEIHGLIRRIQAPTTLLVHARPPLGMAPDIRVDGYRGACIQTYDGMTYRFI